MNGLEILGILSALMALIAFVLNQYHKWNNDNIWYDTLNLLAGVGLVIYALTIHALPFVLTNSVWAVVSGVDVARYFLKLKKL